MDRDTGKEWVIGYIKKYRYLLLILLTGLFIMLLPEGEQETAVPVQTAEIQPEELETKLAEILSQISGVGRSKVLLTQAAGASTVYQTDSNLGQSSSRQDTVILSDGSREESGLVRQVNPPIYLGAIVVCQGADSANIRLAVVEAVKSVTGLSSDCITVLKMK